MNRNHEIAKVFRQAADNCMRFGLEKNFFGEDYKYAPKCVLGHCSFIETKETNAERSRSATPAIRYLYSDAASWKQIPITSFNDDPETTKDDIASLLLSEACYLESL